VIGWDVLLKAYFSEFSEHDNVALYIHTYLYGATDSRNPEKIEQIIYDYLDKSKLISKTKHLPKIRVLTNELAVQDMPSLYKAADAFVLPTRGEGFGLTMLEAMAMELPTIATNWSGNTDFMTAENSYLISVEKMVPSPMWGDESSNWAEPSVDHLKQIMRYVYNHPSVAKQKGLKGRNDIKENFSQEKVGALIVHQLLLIQKMLSFKKKE